MVNESAGLTEHSEQTVHVDVKASQCLVIESLLRSLRQFVADISQEALDNKYVLLLLTLIIRFVSFLTPFCALFTTQFSILLCFVYMKKQRGYTVKFVHISC